jgi:hypothetical protein
LVKICLYILYTADLPSSPDTLTATFADDTVILILVSVQTSLDGVSVLANRKKQEMFCRQVKQMRRLGTRLAVQLD